ncbi:MAG: ParB/RepB/Spo0J family partition protein [bacterium]|nr:ParB/RepB/Spo0J family partition protein [bacterium]
MGKFNMALSSYNDIFESDNTRGMDKVVRLKLSQLVPYNNQPFKVLMDSQMSELEESIQHSGVLSPIIVRPYSEGRYEILSGHRRTKASELAGLDEIPAVIKELDDDESAILLVDSNLHRETLLPSEKAFAYKLKLEAMKRCAGRPKKENNFVQVGQNSRDELARQTGESSVQIQRYLRLTHLVKPLLDLTDEKKLAFNTAVELSYLTEHEQSLLTEAIETAKPPSLAQAEKMHKFSISEKLTGDVIVSILSEKKPSKMKVTLKSETLNKYFPDSYSAKQIEETLISLLENWKGVRA